MLVSVKSVIIPTIEADDQMIRIEAENIEAMILADDLFEAAETNEISFVFDKANTGHRKYLLKLLQSQRACRGKKSFGEMLEALPGTILSLSEAFIER